MGKEVQGRGEMEATVAGPSKWMGPESSICDLRNEGPRGGERLAALWSLFCLSELGVVLSLF